MCSSDLEMFVTLSGKPSARPLSWRGWKTRPWIARLCGTISQPSTATRGVESWISSLRDTRASHSPSLAVAPELKILVTSGPMSPGSSGNVNLDLFSSKTSPAILTSDLMKSPATWTAWATKLRQHCLQRRKSAQATGGNGCSSWPTAQAHDVQPGNAERVDRYGTKHDGRNLTDDVTMWRTPASQEPGVKADRLKGGAPCAGGSAEERNAASGAGEGAGDAAWEHGQRAKPGGRSVQDREPSGPLEFPAPWPPGPSDFASWREALDRWPELAPALAYTSKRGRWSQGDTRQSSTGVDRSLHELAESSGGKNRQLESHHRNATGKGKKLNPLFVEWMMGLPRNWTSIRMK